jgi:hypothetical protein
MKNTHVEIIRVCVIVIGVIIVTIFGDIIVYSFVASR